MRAVWPVTDQSADPEQSQMSAPISANTYGNRRQRADPQAARFQYRAVVSLLEASTVENTVSKNNRLLG